jgi:hypothetical protein
MLQTQLTKSRIEQERLKNIELNKELLASLDIQSAKDSLVAPSATASATLET